MTQSLLSPAADTVAALKDPALRPAGFQHPAGDIDLGAVRGGMIADTNVGEPGCATVDSWFHYSCVFWCTGD